MKSAQRTSEMYYSLFFLAFLFFKIPNLMGVPSHEEGTDFYKQTVVSLVQNPSIPMKKWQQWVFIDVMYYSTAFLKFLFSKNVSYLFFAFCVVHNSAWMVLQSKQSCFIFYIIHTLTRCWRTVSVILVISTARPSE